MKKLKWLLLLSLLVAQVAVSQTAVQAEGSDPNQAPGTEVADTSVPSSVNTPAVPTSITTTSAQLAAPTDKITMNKNSKVILHNGVKTTAAQPLSFINGTSYIPLKAIAVEFGYKVGYIAATKQSTATKDGVELRFSPNNKTVLKNGEKIMLNGPAINQAGTFMIPVKSWSQLTGANLSLIGNVMTLTWSTAPKAPTAAFEVAPAEIYAQQTTVQYIDKSVVPSGTGIANESWTNNLTVFDQAGTYTITRQVQDGNGVWSDPYSVTIVVKAPNQPPVADFSTEKSVYRIGENVIYSDRSTDDENSITSTKWTGNEKVFFEAGDYPVTLEVTDRHGLTSQVTKTVTVSNEVLYTRDEYVKLFTPVGDIYPINGASVLEYSTINFTPVFEPAQMVRSNSPETWTEEGIAYQDQLLGEVRFMFHNMNNVGAPVKMYLLATNYGGTTANVGLNANGIGGPNPQVSATGKASTMRYLTSLASKPATTWMTVKPGETKEVLPIISQRAIKPSEVFSAFADLVTDQSLDFQVVVVREGKNPVAELPNLEYMTRDVHVRGTFNGTNREIELNDVIGSQPQRMVIGDGKFDTFQDGYDGLTGNLEVNKGNFGVMYTMNLNRVAPNTLISLNPRGGYYMGAFLVNGKLVALPANGSIIKDQNSAGVLYRTGSTEESVEIVFTIAPGGNLPISMLFTPLPELRW
ncbi:stalk domain-containing protein [Paenibacillus kobensis]|uniref:stalk domain-containing protein n=1 Tax=Paenibacillus kobensis TaxID=59841 RepID=UPI000FD8BC59|nr:stalk domain-containing protein [Paenibacillus kobensis]